MTESVAEHILRYTGRAFVLDLAEIENVSLKKNGLRVGRGDLWAMDGTVIQPFALWLFFKFYT